VDASLATAWINMTSVLTMQGEDARALEAARKGLELDGDSAVAHNNLAVALYFSGQFQEAKRYLDNARNLGYPVEPRFVESLEEKLS
jgi:Flp pilus assembly protein TadD